MPAVTVRPVLPALPGALIRAGCAALCLPLILLQPHPELPGAVLALLLLLRGALLRRPVTAPHLLMAGGALVIGALAATTHHPVPAEVGLAAAAFILCLPVPPPPPASPEERSRAAALLDRSPGDALAPFLLRTDKAYVFAAGGGSVIGYRVRFGIAVASGDPVGPPEHRDAAIAEFRRVAAANGWRPAVLGAGAAAAVQWRASGLRGLAFGRDVVLDVATFGTVGRPFRNLRQAVQRATNAGMTVQVVREAALDPDLRAELTDVVADGDKTVGRGFSMVLDGLMDGSHQHTLLAVGRDRSGRVVAFQRYGIAGNGSDLALDVPWRRRGSGINGMDEKLVAAMLEWGGEHGAQRISLAFAAFPELFDDHHGPARMVGYRMVRGLDGLIRLESLYRFLRKFHAFGPQRFVLFRPLALVPVLAALLTVEFSPN